MTTQTRDQAATAHLDGGTGTDPECMLRMPELPARSEAVPVPVPPFQGGTPSAWPRDGYPLPCCPESVKTARTWVRNSLMGHGCDEAIEPASLIMSELATNAIRHAAESAAIRVACEVGDDGILMLAVLDYGKREPVMLDADYDDEYGRGLAMVNEIADDWGWHWCDPFGKLVWARLKLSQARTPSAFVA